MKSENQTSPVKTSPFTLIDQFRFAIGLVPVLLEFHSAVNASCCAVAVRIAAVVALLCHDIT